MTAIAMDKELQMYVILCHIYFVWKPREIAVTKENHATKQLPFEFKKKICLLLQKK